MVHTLLTISKLTPFTGKRSIWALFPPRFPPIILIHVSIFSCSRASRSCICAILVSFTSFFSYVQSTFTGRRPVNPLIACRFPSLPSLCSPPISGISGLHRSCMIFGLQVHSLIDTYFFYVSSLSFLLFRPNLLRRLWFPQLLSLSVCAYLPAYRSASESPAFLPLSCSSSSSFGFPCFFARF